MTTNKPPPPATPAQEQPKAVKPASEDVVVEMDIGDDFASRVISLNQAVTQVNQPVIAATPVPQIATATTQSTLGDKLVFPIVTGVAGGIVVALVTLWFQRDQTLLRVTANVVDYSSCLVFEDKKHQKQNIYGGAAYVDLLLSHNQDGEKTIRIQNIKADVRPRLSENGVAGAATGAAACEPPSQADSTNTADALDFLLALGPNEIIAKRAVRGKKSAWQDASAGNLLLTARGSSGMGLDRSVTNSDVTIKFHIDAQGAGDKYQVRFEVHYTIGGESKIAQSEWVLIDSPDSVSTDNLPKT